jgi:hypothetical protein
MGMLGLKKYLFAIGKDWLSFFCLKKLGKVYDLRQSNNPIDIALILESRY